MIRVLWRFVRFGAVGIVAFIVDAGTLWVAMHLLGLGLYAGRLVSFVVAATAAWYLNRTFTFADRRAIGHARRQWVAYLLVSLSGGLANLATYTLLVSVVPIFARLPTLGVAAGSVAGMLVNFTAYSRFVFRK